MSANIFVVARSPIRGSKRPILCPTFTRILLAYRDRLIGYSLAREGIDASTVAAFLSRLAAAGIQPDEVITDGSTLYPSVLAEIWPQAGHSATIRLTHVCSDQ